MKHKILIFISIIIVTLFTESCKKSFLDVPAQGQIDEGAVLKDPGAAQNLVTGVYNSLYQGGFGPTTVGFLYYMTVDVASDDADKGSTPQDFSPAKEIDEFTATPNNFIFDNLWKGNYAGINQANKALDILDKATFDPTTIKRLKAEVSYLRGMLYFNLVRLFGGVPKITTIPGIADFNADFLVTRATKADIYTLIISDLQFAVDNLPIKGDANTQVGRANKGAAEGLLAKVYMYQQNWQKVFDLTNNLLKSAAYFFLKNKINPFTDFILIFG